MTAPRTHACEVVPPCICPPEPAAIDGRQVSAGAEAGQAMAEMILVETHGRVGLIRLNRPSALNALCAQLMTELGAQLQIFDADPAIGAIVLTGSDKAFAAGADIKEMQHLTYPGVLFDDFIAKWET